MSGQTLISATLKMMIILIRTDFKKPQMGMMLHACDSRTQKAKAGEALSHKTNGMLNSFALSFSFHCNLLSSKT